MITALIGSHGTGKTTVFKELSKRLPDSQFFTEQVRHQIPKFGYEDPYQFIDDYGIAAFELMNLNAWSVIDPDANTTLAEKRIITERSAVDNYAYYLTLRKTDFDYKAEPILSKIASYYASLIDQFIYFPVDSIPLKADKMRVADINYQHEVDKNILKTLDMFGIGGDCIYNLKSSRVDDRVKEILDVLEVSYDPFGLFASQIDFISFTGLSSVPEAV